MLEVSSFQLEGTDTFHPQVAVFLNLSADHLDRHAELRGLRARPRRASSRNQTADDWAVVNATIPA